MSDKPVAFGGTPIFSSPIPFNCPTLPRLDDIQGRLSDMLASAQITNGPQVRALEELAGERFGRPVVAVSSCTSGLILTLKVLGLTGKVVVPSFTFFATTHAILWNGLEPSFVDIDGDTFNINIDKVETAVDGETTAILAVDVFGNPCDKDRLSAIARRHDLALIADAAHALGSEFRSRPVGSFGDAEVFSLSPTKLVVAGEGGLISCRDEGLAKELRVARDYGNPGNYNCQVLGLNARMAEFNGILGQASLSQLDANVAARRRIANRYRERLAKLPGIRFQEVEAADVSTFKDIAVLIDPADFGLNRGELAEALAAENIPTRTYFHPPAHKQRAYGYAEGNLPDLPVTNHVSDNIICLPVWSHMPDDIIDKVCLAVERIQGTRVTGEG